MSDGTNGDSRGEHGDQGAAPSGDPKVKALTISVFNESPERAGSAPARRVNVEVDSGLGARLSTILSKVATWSAVLWQGDLRKAKGFESAQAIAIDWDMRGQDLLPDYLHEPARLAAFVESLAAPGAPAPMFAHATPHGVRLIFLLKCVVTDREIYRHAVVRLALEYGADLAAVNLAQVFRCGDIVESHPLVVVSKDPLDLMKYLATPPAFAIGSDSAELYEQALEQLGLNLGSNPSCRCPRGGHGDSTDNNLAVYNNSCFCFSKHGYIPRQEVVAAAGLAALSDRASPAEILREQSDRFVAADLLHDMAEHELARQLGWADGQLRRGSEVLVAWATRHREADDGWISRLGAIFHNRYPRRAFEYITAHGLAHRSCGLVAGSLNGFYTPSYSLESLAQRDRPGKALTINIAPNLCFVTEGGDVLLGANGDRFQHGERHAIIRSSLVGLDLLDRPMVGASEGWAFPRGELPVKTVPVKLTAAAADQELLERFFAELHEAVAFASDEDFAAYVSYLCQPMVVHTVPGQFAAFAFLGPTKGGKDYLASGIPNFLYQNSRGDPVIITRLPGYDYELQVLLSRVLGQPYLVFTEVVDATAGQLKILDALVTQSTLQCRKLYVGYLDLPNRLTVALTAIAKGFADETAGRLVEIQLTETRPTEIAAFHRRWQGAGPVILRTLHDQLLGCDIDQDIPLVEGRRPGFGILQKCLVDAFGLHCSFKIRHSPPPILDTICRMHRSPVPAGVKKQLWTRYSIRNVGEFLREEMQRSYNPTTVITMVTSALGYTSTRMHPEYGETGFPSEDGGFFHIEVREERQGKKARSRKFVYVQDAEGSPEDDGGGAGGDDDGRDATSSEPPVGEDNDAGRGNR